MLYVISIIIGFVALLVYWLFFRVGLLIKPFRYGRVQKVDSNHGHYLLLDDLPVHSDFVTTSRHKIDLNQSWQIDYPDGRSMNVNLPHIYNTANSKYKNFEGTVVYRRTYKVDEMVKTAIKKGQAVHLVMEGSFYKTHVYINGRLMGSDHSGYLPYRLDISEVLDNHSIIDLKILVNNRIDKFALPPLVYPGHATGFHPYGGIHKPVYLEVLADTYLFKLHVEQKNPRLGEIFVNAIWYGEKRPENPSLVIISPDGQELVAKSIDIRQVSKVWIYNELLILKEAMLWSEYTPYLYKIVIKTKTESLEDTFGLRIVDVNEGYFRINEDKTLLKGVCRHEEDVSTGLAQSHDMMDLDLKLIQDMHMNYVRLTHYPHDPYFIRKCDEKGLMLWEEIPLYQGGLAPIKYIADKSTTREDRWIIKAFRTLLMFFRTNQITQPKLLSNARDELLRMIERDFNRPSIIIWGIGNECWTLNPAGKKAIGLLKKESQNMDKSRLCGYAAMTIPNLTERFERSFSEMDIIGINEYYGWYYGETKDVKAVLNSIHKKYPDKPILITETGADAAYGFSSDEGIKSSNETYQKQYLIEQLNILKDVPNFAGFSIWVLKDFLCPEYGTDNIIPYYNLKGLLSPDYEKKAAFEAVKKILGEGDWLDEENRESK